MTVNGLLFLAHRIPYPPDKGDKIRSYHLLRHLAERYRVHLGAFVDDPEDWQHAGTVEQLCAETRLVPLRPALARVRSLRGLLTGQALSLPYFHDRRMAAWVRSVLTRGDVRRVLVFSSAMAPYVLHERRPGLRRVLDFVDVDSDKWRQYAARKRWPLSAVYRREARALLRFERTAAREFDSSVFVSAAEAKLFRRLAPEAAQRVTHVENGVDTAFFAPDREYPDPYEGHRDTLVFTGAMDYWANVDAVTWFARELLPRIRGSWPEAQFTIVGSRPADAVRALDRLPGVTVTGRVPDVRPYLAWARAAVAPLRIARGIQNKVLEAMAMARPVIVTPEALDGLEYGPPYPLLAREAGDWAKLCAAVAEGRHAGLGPHLRGWVAGQYGWTGKMARFRELLESGTKAETGDYESVNDLSCSDVPLDGSGAVR